MLQTYIIICNIFKRQTFIFERLYTISLKSQYFVARIAKTILLYYKIKYIEIKYNI